MLLEAQTLCNVHMFFQTRCKLGFIFSQAHQAQCQVLPPEGEVRAEVHLVHKLCTSVTHNDKSSTFSRWLACDELNKILSFLESEIRARLQSASPTGYWTELDDVKRLLRGSHSTSTSPPQSPNNTLPIPKKPSVETRTMSESSGTGSTNHIWSGGVSGSYSYNTNHNNLSTTSTLYQSGQPSSPINDEASGKDFNYVLIEKENSPVKKETERLVMAKDTGKQFMSAAPTSISATYSEDSLKREKQKLSSSTVEEGTDAKCKRVFIKTVFVLLHRLCLTSNLIL
uniref:Uncharacterized protein n=1 Tax=Anabas testudineus TaxID=64144 RepID=A0A3Q1HBF7_ANATE